jgi:hypothetical protein
MQQAWQIVERFFSSRPCMEQCLCDCGRLFIAQFARYADTCKTRRHDHTSPDVSCSPRAIV